MGKKNRGKQKNQKSFQRKRASLDIKGSGLKRSKFIVFGLRNLDKSQGEGYEEWESEELLSKCLSRFQGLCSMTLAESIQQQIIKIYGAEIPENSKFKQPNHIAEGTKWASIKIQGKERVIGFIEDNHIFQVVFLDKEHLFYPSEKKNT